MTRNICGKSNSRPVAIWKHTHGLCRLAAAKTKQVNKLHLYIWNKTLDSEYVCFNWDRSPQQCRIGKQRSWLSQRISIQLALLYWPKIPVQTNMVKWKKRDPPRDIYDTWRAHAYISPAMHSCDTLVPACWHHIQHHISIVISIQYMNRYNLHICIYVICICILQANISQERVERVTCWWNMCPPTNTYTSNWDVPIHCSSSNMISFSNSQIILMPVYLLLNNHWFALHSFWETGDEFR